MYFDYVMRSIVRRKIQFPRENTLKIFMAAISLRKLQFICHDRYHIITLFNAEFISFLILYLFSYACYCDCRILALNEPSTTYIPIGT